MDTIHYMLDNAGYLASLTFQHLWLVALAVGLAIIIGVPLGVLIVRHKWLATPVLGAATLLLTIPSIALFGLMIPLFSLIGHGIGVLPAVTAVFLYSLLPIVRNTHTALDSLPPGLREAGRGIGMTFWQRLRWVEIPMALPVIFGGIRTAVVMNIGVMAIAAVIGAGGLGLLLLNGISGSDIRMLIAGALMICLLAIVLDWLLHRLQVVLTPKGYDNDKTGKSHQTICTEKGSAAKSRRQRQPERAGRRNVRLTRSLRLRQNHHVKDDQPADRAQQR